MSKLNVTRINTTTLNADTGGIKDAYATATCSSGGYVKETRIVSSSVLLQTHSGGSIVQTSLIIASVVNFACLVGGKVKLLIPVYLATEFDCESNMTTAGTEAFNSSTTFSCISDGAITRFAGLRKGNPSIIFNLYSLQYLNAGRIIINKNKYL